MPYLKNLLCACLLLTAVAEACAWTETHCVSSTTSPDTWAGSSCQRVKSGEIILKIEGNGQRQPQKVINSVQELLQKHHCHCPLPPDQLVTGIADCDLTRTYLLHFTGDLDPAHAARLAGKLDGVIYAQPNRYIEYDFVPNDPLFDNQWALLNQGQPDYCGTADIRATWAWEYSAGDHSVIVAVIDSGIDAAHPDLDGCLWTNPNEIPANGLDDDSNGYIDDVHGWDFAEKDPIPDDDYGHGTHVAGIIAATTHNRQGISGIAPGCRIMALRAGSVIGLDEFAAAQAIIYSVLNGSRIINASWGCYCELPSVRDALMFAQNAGVLCIAAAGNDGTSALHFPAAYPGVLSVAATDSADKRARFSAPYSSNFGGWIDLCAPGAGILSTLPAGNYALRSGTSMAAPMVSATAGLVLSCFPSLTADDITQRLTGTADPIDTPELLFPFSMGTGRLNALSAVRANPSPIYSVRQLRILDASGDNRLQPGEHFQLDLRLRNVWLSSDVICGTLEFPSRMVLLDAAQHTWTGIETGEEDWVTPGFTGYLADSCRQNQVINGFLHLSSTDSVIKQTLPIWIVAVDSKPTQRGWPVSLPDKTTAAPLLTDLDGDGMCELIVGCRDSHIYGFDVRGQPIPGWPVTAAGGILATPASFDIDGDGLQEICVGDDRSSLLLLDTAGQTLADWPLSTGGHGAPSSPVIMDIDGDCRPEVIDADWNGVIRVCAGDGASLPGWPVTIGHGVNSSPAVADLNADGSKEIVIAAKDGHVHVWNSEGQTLSGWPLIVGESLVSAPAIADLDGDGDPEIVCADSAGKVAALHHDGLATAGWPRQLDSGTVSAPALGDLDSDGMLEIVIGSSSGHVYVFTWNGLLATGWPVETGERIEGGPLLVDAEGDGSLDIVLGAGNHLYIWDREGHPLNGWPLELDSQIRASCAAADMDADGDIELACCTSNGSIHVRDVSGPGVQPNTAWTCFSRDTSRSGAIPCHQPAPVIHAVYVIPNQPAWYLLAIATDPRGLPLVVHTASPGSAPITLLPITNGMFGMSITPQLAQQIERGIQVWAESTAGYTSSLWPYLPGCQTSEPDQAPPGGTPMRDLPIILGGGYGLSRFNEHGGSCSLTVAILAAADAPIREVKVLHEGLDTGLRLLDDGISGDNSPNDGIYGLKASLGPGMTIPENPLLIEIVAVDNNGQTSNTWPALPVPVHH